MPKELIHFTIAERTAQRLTGTRFEACLTKENSALLLGSVLHDALFYAALPGGKPLEALSHKLHGARGQDSFDIIRIQTMHATEAKDKSLPTALLVGLVSHLCADVTMHPLVYHFTGDYYDDDPAAKSLTRQRHRALESLMDMVACPDKIGRASYLLRHLIRRCPNLTVTGLPLSKWATLADMTPDETAKQLRRAWLLFALLQSWLPITGLARALFAIRSFAPAYVAELAMLFYAPQLRLQAQFLSGTINYVHPVTGAPLSASLEDLMNEAADNAADICCRLESVVFDGSPLDLPDQGPSMDAGLSGVSTREMLHFAENPFPLLD